MNPSTPFWWPDTKSLLAGLTATATVAVIFALIFKPDAATNDMLKMLLGGLLTIDMTVFGYYFGSSAGSKDKADTIATIARGQANGLAPQEPKP